MANVNNPYGFLPAGSLDGGADYIKMCSKLVGYATAIGIGDVVDYASGGPTVGDINRMAAGGVQLGVALAYSPASTAATIPVTIARQSTLFEAQESGNIGLTGEGSLCNVVVTGSASATTGRAGSQIDSASLATTNTLDCRIIRPLSAVGNDATSSNARWLVTFNDLRLTDQKAGL